ncbi:hypothetical protein GW17_00050489 [Ensete ventricosum]|nr:hypothetical protein GW17_00050489 [Ensete ventricosum]
MTRHNLAYMARYDPAHVAIYNLAHVARYDSTHVMGKNHHQRVLQHAHPQGVKGQPDASSHDSVIGGPKGWPVELTRGPTPARGSGGVGPSSVDGSTCGGVALSDGATGVESRDTDYPEPQVGCKCKLARKLLEPLMRSATVNKTSVKLGILLEGRRRYLERQLGRRATERDLQWRKPASMFLKRAWRNSTKAEEGYLG